MWGVVLIIIAFGAGYLLATAKMWECVLESWKAMEIKEKLEGYNTSSVEHRIGWLEGHRDIVRQLDMSPWTWWWTKQRVVEEVVHESNTEAKG